MSEPLQPVVLVTGGAGFLGRFFLDELLRVEDAVLRPARIRVFDVQAPPAELSATVEYVQGDIGDRLRLREAMQGVDLVFHLAAMIDWGQHAPERVHEVNLEGTRRVIAACQELGVRGLVQTSSLDAIYGGEPIHDADERWPYPARFPTPYCASKALAEQAVLAANTSALRTIVLRPCSIWGEGDPYHFKPMLEAALLGFLPRVGRGALQCTYVGNVAYAVALAGQAVLAGRADACGEVYFVTDFPPRSLFDQMAPMLRAAGVRVLDWSVPRAPAMAAAYLTHGVCRVLRPLLKLTPSLTPFSVAQLCEEFTVASDKAERLLGYHPRFSEEEAYARAIAAARAYGR